MKYNKEKLEQHIDELINMTNSVDDDIVKVWESQCIQPDQFDTINKSEQITLVDIFAKMNSLKEDFERSINNAFTLF